MASSVLVSPLLFALYIFRNVSNERIFFQGCSQLLSIIPFRFGTYLRAAFYTHACHDFDREVTLGFLTLLSHSDVDIHKNVYIGSQCNIGTCSIGKDTLLGSGVHILSGKQQHNTADANTPIRLQGGKYQKISIGENCWIGNNATVMANVGANSIVAAGSVVVEDLASGTTAAGNPARVIKAR